MTLLQVAEGKQGSRVYDAEGLAATGGAKNNFYRVGTLRTHKDGEGFREMQSDVSPTLNARARQDGSIRRLTPIECERLQALPDNWTEYGMFDGRLVEISDTQRYKMLGNAFTASVIEAIVSRMIEKGCLR